MLSPLLFTSCKILTNNNDLKTRGSLAVHLRDLVSGEKQTVKLKIGSRFGQTTRAGVGGGVVGLGVHINNTSGRKETLALSARASEDAPGWASRFMAYTLAAMALRGQPATALSSDEVRRSCCWKDRLARYIQVSGLVSRQLRIDWR